MISCLYLEFREENIFFRFSSFHGFSTQRVCTSALKCKLPCTYAANISLPVALCCSCAVETYPLVALCCGYAAGFDSVYAMLQKLIKIRLLVLGKKDKRQIVCAMLHLCFKNFTKSNCMVVFPIDFTFTFKRIIELK